jgi:SnoaL-like domain
MMMDPEEVPPMTLDITTERGPIAADTIETLADRAAVCRLPQLYALGIDLRDEAMVRSVFAPHAIIRGVLGEAPVDEYVPKLLAGVAHYEATMHNITNQYVVVQGDDAAVWSYAVALHFERPETGRADMAMGVQYRDQLARTELGWSVTARHTVKLWSRG